MTAPECVEDPTVVACTGEDLGRELDPLPVVELPVEQPTELVVEIGTADPAPTQLVELASTGPADGLLLVGLALVVAGWVLTKIGQHR